MYEMKRCPRTSVRINARSEHTLDFGIGLNWHQNWRPPSAPRDSAPPVEDTEKWELLFSELSVIRPHSIRYGYAADKWVDDKGEMDFSAEGFTVLGRLDRWARKHDATIIVDPWIIPGAYSFGEVGGKWCDAPEDIDAFVSGFVQPLLVHVVRTMKCERVTHLSLMNEPFYVEGGAFSTPPEVDPFLYYVELHHRIREMIEEEGFSIGLIGPDTNNTFYWACEEIELRGIDASAPFDVLDHHHYTGRFDYLPPNPTTIPSIPLSDVINSHLKKYVHYARRKGKPYCITEFGTGYYGWSNGDPFGPASQEAAVTDAEFLIRAASIGVSGFYRWAFLAPGEYQDGAWQFVSTVDGSYQRMPHTFYGFAALMRYSSRGGRLWVPEVGREQGSGPYQYVHALGVENPDDTFTVFLVNDHTAEERIVKIQLPSQYAEDKWQKLLNDRVRKMYRNEVQPVAGVIEDCVPPMSLTVYTTRRVDGDELFPKSSDVKTVL